MRINTYGWKKGEGLLRWGPSLAFEVAAALLLATMPVVAQGPYSNPPAPVPQVLITVGSTPDTPWRVEVDAHRNTVLIAHARYPDLRLVVDADGPEDDSHYEGITILAGDRHLEGLFHGNTVSFLSPDHDAGRTQRVWVQAMQEQLRVRFEAGAYRNLADAGSDEPVPFEAVFRVDAQHRLAASLNGLYYLFPSTAGTRVYLSTAKGEISRWFESRSAAGYEYFEGVTKLVVEDGRFGEYVLEGFIQRVQLHHHGNRGGELFEIDLDHSYKDRGQKEVLLRFLLQEPLIPARAEAESAKPSAQTQ